MILEDGVLMPRRATVGSAGYDVFAPYDIEFEPGVWYKIDLGFRFENGDLPTRTHVKLYPRSGFGSKYGMRIRNTVGVIDEDYRDNVLARISVEEPLQVIKGQALLQFVIEPYYLLSQEIPPTAIRDGGFGSTDKCRS